VRTRYWPVYAARGPAGPSTTWTIEFLLGNGSSIITSGLKPTAIVVVPRAGKLLDWTLLSCDDLPTSGSIEIDIWKNSYINYPPTVSDSIVGSVRPNLSSAIKNKSTSLSGWTTDFLAGDIFIPNVDSISALRAVKLLFTYSLLP
jgi:hypothetical protein